jgi:hypothetical protein
VDFPRLRATCAARVVAVHDEVAVVDARCRGGVGAAFELDGADQRRVGGVADVEDVDALEPGWHRLAVTGPALRGRRVPRPYEDVLPHDDVALVAVAFWVRDEPGSAGRGDVDDPESVVVAVVGELALECEVGVDEALAVGDLEGRRLRAVPERAKVLRVFTGPVICGGG